MTIPKLSYIIATRNDGHCGDAMDRLENTLERIQVLQPDAEIVVVDYGSDGEELVRMRQWLQKARYVYVPQAVGKPFHETLALNIGIRRARGEWIARLDQDILIGEKWVGWFESGMKFSETQFAGLNKDDIWGPAFFSLRRDLPKDIVQPLASEYPYKFMAPIWNHWPANAPNFFLGAVGILLAPRQAWWDIHGYDESLKYRNHMEHDLCLRFKRTCGLVNLGPLVDCDFYHQWHETHVGVTNPLLSISEIESRLANAMMYEGHLRANDENWGLGNINLEEQ